MSYQQHYAGADWLERQKITLSPFGRQVADLLGEAFRGLYHITSPSFFKADWQSNRWIRLSVHGPLSTFDSSGLTRLVLLAHERCVRLEIEGAAPGYLRLSFAARSRDAKDIYDWHPTVAESVVLLSEHDPGNAAARILAAHRTQESAAAL